LAGTIRSTDIIARYGGDEFIVLLPSTDVEGAEKIAGRIIRQIQESPDLPRRIEALSGKKIEIPEGRPLTCSIGISSSILSGNDPEAIIKSADQALYEAKQAGKKCYRISGGVEPTQTKPDGEGSQ
jgi:diguanylate cyclase (GGDEF)-like protein